jgi:hypothetical protein
MNRYLLAGIITAAILAVVFAVVSLLDDARISTLNRDIDDFGIQSESSRLLFFYNQVFSPIESKAFCEITNKSATARSNEGDLFYSKIAEYEQANLLGNYSALKKKYILNRVELWLYTTLQVKTCDSNFVPVLFFYSTKPACPECEVQGQILEEIRNECPNVKVFALATDEGIDLVSLAQAQFGISTIPSVVVNNKDVFSGLKSKQELLKDINCLPGS